MKTLLHSKCNNVLLNYQNIHSHIMNLDHKIRLVTICDSNGKIMFSDHRPGVINLLSPEESRKSLEMAVEDSYSACREDRKRQVCSGRI